MAIFFKKAKKQEKEETSEKLEKKEEQVSALKEEKEAKKTKQEKRTSHAWRILKKPHITEKATNLLEDNQYVFEVFPKANKIEIKKVIEDFYKVDVLNVKIINIPPKKRRLGRISGWQKGYKKAIVKIKEGQKIELLPR